MCYSSVTTAFVMSVGSPKKGFNSPVLFIVIWFLLTRPLRFYDRVIRGGLSVTSPKLFHLKRLGGGGFWFYVSIKMAAVFIVEMMTRILNTNYLMLHEYNESNGFLIIKKKLIDL